MIDGEEKMQAMGQAVTKTPRIYQINNDLKDQVGRLGSLKNRLRQTVVQLGGGWPEAGEEGNKEGMSGEECSLDLLTSSVCELQQHLNEIEDYMNRLNQLV